MVGYRDDQTLTDEVMRGGYYHTGDVASRDADGYITYVGRTDDVFKASDYRISPFELESVLIEHPAVAEAAVVPAPDPVRLAVPKAYVVLAAGHAADAETAPAILALRARAPGAVQADPPAGVRRPAQDDQRQDPPGRAAQRRDRARPRRRGPTASSARRTSPTSRAEPAGCRTPASAEGELAGQVLLHQPAHLVGSVTVGEDHELGEGRLERHVAP